MSRASVLTMLAAMAGISVYSTAFAQAPKELPRIVRPADLDKLISEMRIGLEPKSAVNQCHALVRRCQISCETNPPNDKSVSECQKECERNCNE